MTKNEARTLLQAVNICMNYNDKTCVDCPYHGIKKEHSELCGMVIKATGELWDTVRKVVIE